jgi:hypothetical protein
MKPVFDPWLVIIVSCLGSHSLRPPSLTTVVVRAGKLSTRRPSLMPYHARDSHSFNCTYLIPSRYPASHCP